MLICLQGFSLVWFYGTSTIIGYLTPNPFLYIKTVLFQTIQFSISTVSMSKTVLFQAIQFTISLQFSSIWPTDRTLSGANTQGQSRSGSNVNERVIYIPQSSRITGTSPWDCLVSYPGHSLGWGLGVLPLCTEALGKFQRAISPSHPCLSELCLPFRAWGDPEGKCWGDQAFL